MIHTASGTQEGQGPNKPWPRDSNCRDLGFTSITDNASTTHSAASALGPGGISPGKERGEALVNAINTSADTTMTAVPEGTLESQGANG